MNLNKAHLRSLAGYAALVVLLYWGLQNLEKLAHWLGMGLGLFMPFFIGLTLAFILNVPMVQLEHLLFKKVRGRLRSMARMLSMTLTILLVAGLIFIVFFLVVPELASSVTMLGNSVPGYIMDFSNWAMALSVQYPEVFESLATVQLDWNTMFETAMLVIQNGVTTLLRSTVNAASGIFSGLFSFLLAFVFAIYVLLQKETLREQGVQVLYSYLPAARADRIMYISALTNRTFVSFISGQCLEAVILGLMFFFSMSVIRLPYALMISVLIGFTALIPIFGAFIGCAVGTFLILMINPMQALIFLLLFIVLQQVEGNLIYPKVVGGSIGLPGIWVLLAVTVGGSAMGIAGMLLFIPLCSVLYALLWENIEKRKEAQMPQKEEDIIEKAT